MIDIHDNISFELMRIKEILQYFEANNLYTNEKIVSVVVTQQRKQF